MVCRCGHRGYTWACLHLLSCLVTNFSAWWTEEQWVWTVCLRLLLDSVATAIWAWAVLRLSPACKPLGYRATHFQLQSQIFQPMASEDTRECKRKGYFSSMVLVRQKIQPPNASENAKVAENYSLQKMQVWLKIRPPYMSENCWSVWKVTWSWHCCSYKTCRLFLDKMVQQLVLA